MTDALSEDDFADIEQSAYEAAIVPERWPDVLARLGEISGSAGAAILCVNERGIHLANAPVLETVAQRFLAEGWATRSGRIAGVQAHGLVGFPRFVNEDDYFDPGQAEADPMVNELFRKEGFGWAAGFLVALPHGDFAVMNVEQYYERGPIRGEALERLNRLYPHLARAIMLSGRTDFQRVRTAIETLRALGMSAAALTPTGRVTLANEDFSAATHVWTTRGGDRLGLHDKVADALLTETLANLTVADAPRSIPLRAELGGQVTAVLQVIPIRRSGHDIFGSTSAIVVLSEPKEAGREATLIHSLFDLTPAELGVAQAIAGGNSLAEIASSSGRSINTVRNQLKSAMSKTGSTRQVELALLMNQLKQQG